MNDRLRAWNFLKSALFGRVEESSPSFDGAQIDLEGWRRILTLANAHFVTPALWPRLQDGDIVSSLPCEARDYLEAIHEVNRRRNIDLLRQLDELLCALNDRSIVPTLLKGAGYLKTRLHGDNGTRFLADLDILVQPHELDEAGRALGDLGYLPSEAGGGRIDYERRHHHGRPLVREGEPGVVEIHREALSADAASVLPTRDVSADACEHVEQRVRYTIPSPSHVMMVSFLHSEVTDRHLQSFVVGLRPMLDFLAMNAAYGRRIDWPMLGERFTRSGLGNLFRQYLYYAWRITGVLPLPELRFRTADHAHYRLSETRVRRPRVDRWLSRLTRLSAAAVQGKYGPAHNPVSLARYRLRRARVMAGGWIRRRLEYGLQRIRSRRADRRRTRGVSCSRG